MTNELKTYSNLIENEMYKIKITYNVDIVSLGQILNKVL